MQKIALCFFGLTRSLRYVYHETERFLIRSLEAEGYTVHKYLHTYSLYTLTNLRTGEMNASWGKNDFNLLGPFEEYEIEDQDAFVQAIDLELYTRNGRYAWGRGKETLRNLICQLHSLERVTTLWRERMKEYSLVVYSRPDVRYLSMVHSAYGRCSMNAFDKRFWIVPDFHAYLKGLNDRFAIGTPEVMQIWGNRIQYALEFVQETNQTLHPEQLVKYVANREAITVCRAPVRFVRVRANGLPWSFFLDKTNPHSIRTCRGKYQEWKVCSRLVDIQSQKGSL